MAGQSGSQYRKGRTAGARWLGRAAASTGRAAAAGPGERHRRLQPPQAELVLAHGEILFVPSPFLSSFLFLSIFISDFFVGLHMG